MDSTNKTFLVMLLLTGFLFAMTTYQTFFNKKDTPLAENISVETESTNKDLPTFEKTTAENFKIINTESNIENAEYNSDKLKIVFDVKRAEIKSAVVKYGDNENGHELVNGRDGYNAMAVKLGSWNEGMFFEDLIYNLEIEGNVYKFFVEFLDVAGTKYKLEKIFTFIDNEYVFKCDVKLSNDKKQPMRFDNTNKVFSIGWGPTLGEKVNKSGKRNPRYDQYRYLSSEKIINIVEKNKIFKSGSTLGYGEISKGVRDSWLSADGHYFTAIMVPDGNDYSYFFDNRKVKDDVSYGGFSLITNKSVIETSFNIYLGPKKRSVLKQYDDFQNGSIYMAGLDLVKLDPPIIFGLGDLLGVVLNFINKLFNNYGISIIVITILLKLLLAPLTHKSMTSQKKMQELQPKIKEIQAKYKDKPEMLNKKTMELYQKAGINPMAGCLPLLLQMPLLFSMYQLLDRLVELKGSSFLWISDLAMPDAIFEFGFILPLLNSNTLNILPIIMVVTQVAQSFLTPDMSGNSQAKMMMWMMPIIFFFFFYNVSSGLVLYWTVMNLLGIIQQLILNAINKKQKA